MLSEVLEDLLFFDDTDAAIVAVMTRFVVNKLLLT